MWGGRILLGALVATAVGHSLSVLDLPDAVVVASEPLDDRPAWRPVPEGTLLTATATDLTLTPLPRPDTARTSAAPAGAEALTSLGEA